MMPQASSTHLKTAKGGADAAFRLFDAPLAFSGAQAREQAMMDQAASLQLKAGGFLWSMPQALVVPKSIRNQERFSKALAAMAARGWPVHVRVTGGDLTPQTSGVVNISYIFTDDWGEALSIEAMYQRLCQPILDYLKDDLSIDAYCSSVEGAFCDGKYNIVVDGLKIAGTAQKWRPFHNAQGQKCVAVLGHVALLVDAPIGSLIAASNEFYLECGIEKRLEAANHANLSSLAGAEGVDASKLMRGLLGHFEAEHRSSSCRA